MLTELNLSGNFLGHESEGVSCLAGALASNTGLRKLDLQQNALTQIHGVQVSEALLLNTSLEEVNCRLGRAAMH